MIIRITYEERKFFNTREQTTDETEATEASVRKAFNFMKRNHYTTSVFFEYDGYSIGYTFINEEDFQNSLLTVIKQEHQTISSEYWKQDFHKAKKQMIKEVTEQPE